MNYSILVPISMAFITGLAVKFVDDYEDIKASNPRMMKNILGAIYGMLIGYMIILYPGIAPLWISVVIGVLIAGKINAQGHYFALASMLLILISKGIPKIETSIVALFVIVTFVDEILKDGISDNKSVKNKTLKHIFSYRPLLEVCVLFYAAITGNWIALFALIAFDLGYLVFSPRVK